MKSIGVVLLLIAGALGACAEPTDNPTTAFAILDAPEWRLPADPSFQAGTEGGEAYQLDQVRGALRLSNGNIAVLDGGSSELRVFDREGKHVSTPARKGAGPGEIEMPWTMYRRGDTIFVVDVRRQHLSVFGPDGDFIGTAPVDLHGGTGNVYLHDASVVAGSPDGAIPDGTDELISRLPRPPQYVRNIRVAGSDRLWFQSDTAGSEWIVVDGAGTAIGRMSVPANFTAYEFGRDHLLGVWEDSLGVQSVREYPLPAESEARRVPAAPRKQQQSSAGHEPLRQLLDRLQLYQEHFYSRPEAEYTYAASMDELSGFRPPATAGVQPLDIPASTVVRIIRGDRTGWFGVAADTVGDATCAVGHGFAVPAGWTNGTVACF